MVVLQRFEARVQSLCISCFLFFKADQPLLVPPVNLPSKMQANLRGSCQDQSKLDALPATLGAVFCSAWTLFEIMFCHRPGLLPIDPEQGSGLLDSKEGAGPQTVQVPKMERPCFQTSWSKGCPGAHKE